MESKIIICDKCGKIISKKKDNKGVFYEPKNEDDGKFYRISKEWM